MRAYRFALDWRVTCVTRRLLSVDPICLICDSLTYLPGIPQSDICRPVSVQVDRIRHPAELNATLKYSSSS